MELEVSHGTGIYAQVPGYVLAGKTGTAQLVIHGRTSNTQYLSSYLGYGPMPHPRFIMLVMLDQPKGQYYGGVIAAPVFAQVTRALMQYWHIPPGPPSLR
jgi:stage V sporulation protein D (sporulation-specific penicillin-binding protein)